MPDDALARALKAVRRIEAVEGKKPDRYGAPAAPRSERASGSQKKHQQSRYRDPSASLDAHGSSRPRSASRGPPRSDAPKLTVAGKDSRGSK